jgi:hypothetical protein
MSEVVEGYLAAARSAVVLLADDAVADRWEQASALPRMTVGGLAAHLADQVLMVGGALRADPPADTEPPIPLLEHYNRSAWVTASLDDDTNTSIRDGAESAAGEGPDGVLAAARFGLDEATRLLVAQREPRLVRMPWWRWSLRLEDFLVTRMMEITVHSDDLAVSVDVEPLALPPLVLEPVLSLLVGVSVLRHGQPAVVRALSRSERAPRSIAAF